MRQAEIWSLLLVAIEILSLSPTTEGWVGWTECSAVHSLAR
jgi:hypothetical protein